MATAIGLSTVLTQDEIHNLNETVRHKLEALLKQNEGELSTLKIQHVKLQTQSGKHIVEKYPEHFFLSIPIMWSKF